MKGFKEGMKTEDEKAQPAGAVKLEHSTAGRTVEGEVKDKTTS